MYVSCPRRSQRGPFYLDAVEGTTAGTRASGSGGAVGTGGTSSGGSGAMADRRIRWFRNGRVRWLRNGRVRWLATGGSANGGDPSGGGGIRYVGRFDTSDAAGPRFAWSGSRILANFSGTSVSAKLEDSGSNFFAVLIDGMLQPKLHPAAGMGEYPLATGLAEGTHSVELYRLTEASEGNTRFLGFTPSPGGKLLDPSAGPARGIEIIGDSISCGYGDEGPDMDCHFSPTPRTTTSRTAPSPRELRRGPRHHRLVRQRGRLQLRHRHDRARCPTLYDRILPLEPTPTWDFSRWKPEVVVVNLGTNDFSTDDDPAEELFTSSYAALLGRIRTNYPDAFILCVCAPLMDGADYDTVAGYESKVVTQMNDGRRHQGEVCRLTHRRHRLGLRLAPQRPHARRDGREATSRAQGRSRLVAPVTACAGTRVA